MRAAFLLSVVAFAATLTCFQTTSLGQGQPTISTTQSGAWDDPATWGGDVPTALDTCFVELSHVVTIDANSTVFDIIVNGDVILTNNATLSVRTLRILPTGRFAIDTRGHLEILDLPFTDAAQVETGIMNMGVFESTGIAKQTWSRATHDLPMGSDRVVVTDATGWQVGDQILIGNSSFKPFLLGTKRLDWQAQYGQSNIVTITSISGNEVQFAPPLTHDAMGISDNPWGYTAYTAVGNTTKSATVRSQNPSGTRGHIMSMNGADFIVSDTGFYDLGRTSADLRIHPDDNFTGRYAIHFHRATDPATDVVIDNSVVCGFLKWGIALHEVNNSTITNNLICDGDGAGIVAERGNEFGNVISDNMIAKLRGGYQFGVKRAGITIVPFALRPLIDMDGLADIAADGTAIWCRSCGNDVVRNVAVDCAGYGVNLNGYYREKGLVPPPVGSYRNNEVIGCWGGIWATYSQNWPANQLHLNDTMNFVDHLVWNVQENGVQSYHDAFVEFTRLVVVNSADNVRLNNGSGGYAAIRSTSLFQASKNYETVDYVFRATRAYGINTAFQVAKPLFDSNVSFMSIKNCDIHCWLGFEAFEPEYMEQVWYNPSNFKLSWDFEPFRSPVDVPTMERIRRNGGSED